MELFVGEKCSDKIWPRIRLPRNSRDPLHAANLRHGTDGFTSPPTEGVLRIFSPLKIRRLRPGLNPRTWVPKASTLFLDHRSRSIKIHGRNVKIKKIQILCVWISTFLSRHLKCSSFCFLSTLLIYLNCTLYKTIQCIVLTPHTTDVQSVKFP